MIPVHKGGMGKEVCHHFTQERGILKSRRWEEEETGGNQYS